MSLENLILSGRKHWVVISVIKFPFQIITIINQCLIKQSVLYHNSILELQIVNVIWEVQISLLQVVCETASP